MDAQYLLTAKLRVELPPESAFRLFTPRGEEDWVDGWQPRFPQPVQDDTAPGVVFETGHDGYTTTWVVADREPGRRMSYARVTPGVRAGLVTVTLAPAGDGASDVTVTYQLTAFTAEEAEELRTFADDYPAFIRSWQDAIAAWLEGRA